MIFLSTQKPNAGYPLPDRNFRQGPVSAVFQRRNIMETEDKDIILEGIASVSIYDQWIAPSVSGQHPKPRYKVFLFEQNLSCHLVLKFSFFAARGSLDVG